MGSSKKKRGQQRKAEKERSAAFYRDMDNTVDSILPSHWAEELKAQLFREVEKGGRLFTEALLDPNKIGIVDIPNSVYLTVLPTVLNFLKRCEHKSFEGVITSAGDGGRLKSPLIWIKVLGKTISLNQSCNCLMQITKNIGPLVNCMCNDIKRQFFKSNTYWRKCIVGFVQLISDITRLCLAPNSKVEASSSERKVVLDTLLQHEGLLTSIVQWRFWRTERPDIFRELQIEISMSNSDARLGFNLCTDIATNLKIMDLLILNSIKNEDGELTDDGKNRLRSIGTSQIVSKDYDPTCTTSFIVGFIRLIKEEGPWQKESNSLILVDLIADANCVDKDVVKEVIDLGTNHVSDLDSSAFVASLSTYILYDEVGEEAQPSDTRIAFAIRAGFIEMCLGFIDRFGRHKHFGKKVGEGLASEIWFNLDIISEVSLHKKTNKALRHKKDEIQIQLDRLEKVVSSNTDAKDLFEMIECILDKTGSYCCRCNKSLSRTEVKQCNGCHNMTYCSKECQREDWLSGHSVTCCKSYTDETAGQYQGRVLPRTATEDERDRPVLTYDKDGHFQGSAVQPIDLGNERAAAAKLVELEKNITSIQLKLFLDNSEYIKSQTSSLSIPLWDCVVVFDLRNWPTQVTVKKYTDHYMPKAAKGFRKSRSKENITCIYDSYIFNGTFAAIIDKRQHYNVPKLSMQRMFPHKWLLNQK